MLVYVLLLALVALPALVLSHRKLLPLVLLAGLVFVVLIGWRHNVGMDWNNYFYIVERDRNLPLSRLIDGPEPAFGFLVWLSDDLGGLTFVNVVAALIFCIGLFAVAWRSKEPFVALATATPYLVIVIAMSATRQAIALGIVFLLIARWNDMSTVRRLALALVASLFHVSAIVVTIFIVLASRLPSLARFIVAAAVGLVLFTAILTAPERIAFFDEVYLRGRSTIASGGALLHVALIALPAAIYLLVRPIWQDRIGRDDLLDWLSLASIASLPALLISSTAIDRLSLYFWPAAMAIWAGLPSLMNRPEQRILYRFLLIGGQFMILIVWLLYANNRIAWIPYRSSLF